MGKRKKLKNLINAFKDKASIIKATFSIDHYSSSIQIAVVRATTHDADNPPSDRRLAALLDLGNDFRFTACACVESLMVRLNTTSNAAVAMKSLFVLHAIVIRGSFIFRDQIAFSPYSEGWNFLNLSKFRDVSDSDMRDLSPWVRWYAAIVEQNVIISRKLGCVLYFRSIDYEIDFKEAKISGGLKLSGELDVLVDFVERICEVPDSLNLQKNDLVYEVVRLVIENYRLIQREILIRVREIGDRAGCLSLDELTQLVSSLTRYENCRRRVSLLFLNRGKNEALWDLIKETKIKLVEQREMKEGKRMIMVKIRADSVESTRFWNPFVEPGQLLWIPSGDGSLGPAQFPLTVSTVG